MTTGQIGTKWGRHERKITRHRR